MKQLQAKAEGGERGEAKGFVLPVCVSLCSCWSCNASGGHLHDRETDAPE